MELRRPDILLFDLGGVVFNIDFHAAFRLWSLHGELSVDTIARRFETDIYYEQHERGEISASAYFESLRRSLQIDISDDQFTEGWQAIFLDEVTGMRALLENLKKIIPIYAFSNTNALHQRYWASKYPEVLQNFENIYVSSEIGLRKPDAEAFTYVADSVGSTPSQILFFDDSAVNIAGAQSLGMQTIRVTEFSVVTDALASLSLLSE